MKIEKIRTQAENDQCADSSGSVLSNHVSVLLSGAWGTVQEGMAGGRVY